MKYSNTKVEVNQCKSNYLILSRSIRKECQLTPTLFVIEEDKLYYLLRDNSLSPRVWGINLPNGEDLINVQFVDDTSILVELDETNLGGLMINLDLFCRAFGSKVSLPTSIILGWEEHPLAWSNKHDLSWGAQNIK